MIAERIQRIIVATQLRPMPRKVRKPGREFGIEAAPARGPDALHPGGVHSHHGYFERFANHIAHLAGRPSAFLLALATIVIWCLTGPLFGFSDTWQLIINTSTTIITFLMVFLIQNSQNRDTIALQVKLDALIFANRGAKNIIAAAEHLSDHELKQLHEEYHRRAEHALAVLHKRRPAGATRKAGKPEHA